MALRRANESPIRSWLLSLAPIIFLIFPLLSIVCAPQQAKLEPQLEERLERERKVAALYAPVFFQGVGPFPRGDYITNFDFDGDWRGDNNWENCSDVKYPLKAYVYYSLLETRAHFFIHYALFHAQDYKGGRLLSELLELAKERFGKIIETYDPTGLSKQVSLSHENDMEGCLIVVEKNGGAPENGRVVAAEALAHDRFSKYCLDADFAARAGCPQIEARLDEGRRVWFYVEPKGHGVRLYTGLERQENARDGKDYEYLTYYYKGIAEDPEKVEGKRVGYDLLPIITTLWPRALSEEGDTYGEFRDYGVLGVRALDLAMKEIVLSKHFKRLGSAFKGRYQGTGVDKARPPWGWFDIADSALKVGDWFFDPARVVRNHFGLDDSFPTVYLNHPYFDSSPLKQETRAGTSPQPKN